MHANRLLAEALHAKSWRRHAFALATKDAAGRHVKLRARVMCTLGPLMRLTQTGSRRRSFSVGAQNRIPESERRLRDQLEAAQRRLSDLNEQNRQQQQSIDAFARIVNVLTVENEELASQLNHHRRTNSSHSTPKQAVDNTHARADHLPPGGSA
jgi:hypothetical protein